MAKEDKKVTEVNVSNIEEVIKNGAVVTEQMAKEAAEVIAKKRKEELTERLITGMKKSDFTRKKIYLSMKQTNKISEVKLNYLKKFTVLDEDLKSGKISIDEYESKILEERNTANELIRKVDRWYDEQNEALEKQYPEARFNWNYGKYII